MYRPFVVAAFLLAAVQSQSVPAVPIMLDIDTMRTSGTDTSAPIVTQPGFTSLDATNTPEGASITIDGATLTLFGGIDGSRNREPNAAITGHRYEAVLRDFVFNDGGGAAVAVRLEGLEPGTYDVQSFHYDAGGGITGNFQIEVRERGVANSTVILHDNVPLSVEPYLYQISVANPGQTLELIFREDDTANRSRFNGIIITPEPSSACLLALAAVTVLARRRR